MTASPEEAAAILGALQRFERDTGVGKSDPAVVDPWARMAMLEGVGREDEWLSAWGNPHPWINT
jgi:hypothetical protein